jgi:hypothetical protein
MNAFSLQNLAAIVNGSLRDTQVTECAYHIADNDWGVTIDFIVSHTAYARLYWFYNDNKELDITSAYLDSLNVSIDSRRKGLGTALQVLRENIARRVGSDTAYLYVMPGSWQQ